MRYITRIGWFSPHAVWYPYFNMVFCDLSSFGGFLHVGWVAPHAVWWGVIQKTGACVPREFARSYDIKRDPMGLDWCSPLLWWFWGYQIIDLKVKSGVTTKLSTSSIPNSVPACFSLLVSSRSASEGSAPPEG